MNTPTQRRTFLGAMNDLRALLTEPRQLAGGNINGRCHDLPPVSYSESGNGAGIAGGGAPDESPFSTASSPAPCLKSGSRVLQDRAGSEGERTTCSPRSPSHRITEHEARVVLADLVEAMTRRDRAKSVAAILSARFTDDELEWLSNRLGRVPHEGKRACPPHELEQMRKAQRRDLAVIVLAGIVMILLVRATQPEPIEVPTGPGYEICTEKGC